MVEHILYGRKGEKADHNAVTLMMTTFGEKPIPSKLTVCINCSSHKQVMVTVKVLKVNRLRMII